ncbi:LacI family DNA-binding transcriptional regulator [Pedobacter alluvionis]|uniref:LacI family transcriptional regulator n=1 Tax=Pedobacter alluvionis TaxID=475253 RepID=A0A497YAT5_9SPHI|nr:LacI family DNA-binding transcriptional regulator [Pedobacter alluvionis]RLJ80692.1 LacI family transcriptional regulator [Pedobacter alluvionis]TFB31945.1 LacI family transcriptional regulator [Pedobacter alluvionis]
MTNNTPVTLKFLADKLKMSVSTVSKALNNYPTINAYTRQRVQEMARDFHFTPNKSAINLKEKRSRIIGVILPNLLDHFFTRSIYGIEQFATQNGYNVIISQSHDELEKEIQSANMLLRSRVDGLIVAISKHTQDFTHLNQFENIGIPVVYYTRNPSFNLNCHKVLCNTFQGCYQATKLLIDRGHQKIAYLGGPKMINFTHDRFNGYINALKDNEVPFSSELVAYTDFDKENTITAIKNLFVYPENKPTALVAFKEPILFDAIKYLRSTKHFKTNEVECIGFGNTSFISYLDSPPIASIEENPESVGENAISLLIQLINKEIDIHNYQKVMVDCKLIVHGLNAGSV